MNFLKTIRKNKFFRRLLAIASIFVISSVPVEEAQSAPRKPSVRTPRAATPRARTRAAAPRARARAATPRARTRAATPPARTHAAAPRAPRAPKAVAPTGVRTRATAPRAAPQARTHATAPRAPRAPRAPKAVAPTAAVAARQAETLRQQQQVAADAALQAETLRQQQQAAADAALQAEALRQQQEAEFNRIAALAEARDQRVDAVARQNFLNSHFVKVGERLRETIPEGQFEPVLIGDIGYTGTGRTLQYSEVGLPKSPVLFPYHLEDRTNERGFGLPSFPINIKAKYTRNFAPHDLHLNLGDVDDDNIDTFIVAQNLPWLGVHPIQLKPQSWLDPDVANEGDGITHPFTTAEFGVFSDNNGPLIDGQPRGRLIKEERISTHTANGPPNPRQIVSSGNVLSLVNLDLDEYNRESHVFFSLTKYRNPDTGILKAAVVKHVLLTTPDMHNIEAILKTAPHGGAVDDLGPPITLDEFNINLQGRRNVLSRANIADEFDPYPANGRP